MEPYWWAENWTDEEKRIAGDPKNRIMHMKKLVKSVDEFERRMDLEMFGFTVN